MKLFPDLSCIKSIRDEKGQALILVLILLLLAGLIIGPLLAFMSTGLIAGKVYEKKMHEFYAADAGIEDALWHLQSNDRLKELILEVNPEYSPSDDWTPADYNKWPLEYALIAPDSIQASVNRMDVQVTIDRGWVLGGLEESTPNANDHWTVIGAINTDVETLTNYIVDITTDESGNTLVDHIGVWLPPGYKYVSGTTKINGVTTALVGDPPDDDTDGFPGREYRGGTALIWDLPGGTRFRDLSDITPPFEGQPPAEKFPPSIRLSFDYTAKEAKGFFPWIKLVDDGRIAWDTEAGVYSIQSLATEPGANEGTTVEAYTPRGVMRYTSGSGGTSSTIKGDYIAIGNTLMTCCWNEAKTGPPAEGEECCTGCGCCGENPYRNYRPVTERFPIEGESSAQVLAGQVPDDATIERVYLYWTAWLRGDWLYEETHGEGSWQWQEYMGDDHYWEKKAPEEVKQWLAANAYDGEAFLAVNGNPVGTDGTVVKDKWYISEGSSDVQPSYQYACFADVTAQVRAITPTLITDGVGANFTVGGVHAHPAESCATKPEHGWSWNRSSNAGWSIIIIYSSEEKETHQIYLYEGCDHLYQASAEFTIAGFETPLEGDNEAKLTVLASEGDEFENEYLRFKGQNTDYYDLYDVSDTTGVFNSISSTSGFTPSDVKGQPEGEISGLDIDTYIHTRPSDGTLISDIVEPGDTSAKIHVGSTGDGFMLIYVVFSVRSSKVPAAGAEFEVGTISYKIK